jgi:hypothetical protein
VDYFPSETLGNAVCNIYATMMKILLIFLVSFDFAYSLPGNVPNSQPASSGITLSPDEDPFYKPPKGFESAALGSILRYRPAPRSITLDNKRPIRPKDAWQILYKTQNSVNEPEATVVTLLVPFKAKQDNLFVYHCSRYVTSCSSTCMRLTIVP